MGYFSNGTQSSLYEEHYCNKCIHGNEQCSVWFLHLAYNGDTKIAPILDDLIPRDEKGNNLQCTMFFNPEKIKEAKRQLFVTLEIDKMLQDEKCTICGEGFVNSAQKNEAVCAGTKPLKYAHGKCYGLENKTDDT